MAEPRRFPDPRCLLCGFVPLSPEDEVVTSASTGRTVCYRCLEELTGGVPRLNRIALRDVIAAANVVTT